MKSLRKWYVASPGGEAPGDSNGDRGAVLVEAAMITTFIVMLLLGTVTSAMAYSQRTSLQTSAREASRFGATLPVNTDMNLWLTRVLDVAKAAAHDDLSNGVAGQSICVAYVYPNGTSPTDRNTRLRQKAGVTGVVSTGPSATCFNDGRPADERRVQVVVGRISTIQAAVFSFDVELSLESAARFERGN